MSIAKSIYFRFYNGHSSELNKLRNAGNETQIIVGYMEPTEKLWFHHLNT